MKVNIVVSLLFSLIVESETTLCSGTLDLLFIKGRILDGNPFWESITKDGIACAQSCVRMKKCKSINFNRKTGGCELNSQLGTQTKLDKNVVHSDISSWPSQIDEACHHRPCEEDEICISQTPTAGSLCSFSCLKMNSARKCPPPEGTLSSQPRTLGSIFTHACRSGTVGGNSALCLPSGNWNKTIDTTCTPVFGMHCDADTDCAPINGTCTDLVCSCKKHSRYDSKELACIQVPACDEDSILYGVKCYFFGKQNMTRMEASEFCKYRGSHLVQVDTAEENDFLKRTMTEMSVNVSIEVYWNDLFQEGENGQERWQTTNDSLTYSDWNDGEPSDSYGSGLAAERCTTFQPKQYRWYDRMCMRKAAALCQKV